MSDQLISHIRKFVQLTDEEAELISSKVTLVKLKKKAFVLTPGKLCKANYFVAKGLMRLYFISKKDIEQITQFALENWWITDYDSVDSKRPSHFHIQAVEDTEVIVLDQLAEDEIIARIPAGYEDQAGFHHGVQPAPVSELGALPCPFEVPKELEMTGGEAA